MFTLHILSHHICQGTYFVFVGSFWNYPAIQKWDCSPERECRWSEPHRLAGNQSREQPLTQLGPILPIPSLLLPFWLFSSSTIAHLSLTGTTSRFSLSLLAGRPPFLICLPDRVGFFWSVGRVGSWWKTCCGASQTGHTHFDFLTSLWSMWILAKVSLFNVSLYTDDPYWNMSVCNCILRRKERLYKQETFDAPPHSLFKLERCLNKYRT